MIAARRGESVVTVSGRRKSFRSAERLIGWTLVGASVWYVGLYLWIAVHRLAYPFDIEWMEGGAVDHVARLLAGDPIYVKPTLAFVPFFYPPFYFFVSAAVAKVTGIGFFPLRLVSLLSSLGVFGATFALVRRETRSTVAASLAIGVFAATYRAGGAWLDLARVDSLFLLLTIVGVYQVRFGQSTGSWAAAGVLFALAGLTKQTAVLMAAPMLLYALWIDWRRGLGMAAAFVLVLGVPTWILDAASGGWYLKYVLYLPERIQAIGDIPPAIWERNIFGPLPLAWALTVGFVVSRALRRDGAAIFYTLFVLSFVGAAWSSGRHSGAYDNVFIPAHLSLSIGLGLAFAELPRTGTLGAAMRATVSVLCALQLWMLSYSVSAQIPTAYDADLARQLHSLIAAAPGEVFVPHHGFVARDAGKPMSAHEWALYDVLRSADPGVRGHITAEMHDALAGHRYSLIVLDKTEPWFEEDLERYYERTGVPLAGDGLWTRTGYRTRPRLIYTPRLAPESVR